jgi:pSer/pThr/pTyr-binding forkhead associated (FHA) protein
MAPGAGVAAPNAPPRLTGIEGPCTGLTIELAAPVITLGREPDRDVSLSRDTAVSRRHAHVAFENGLHVLYDDGSSNGTYVNGVRITAQPLARGDVLQLGQSKFLYE